MKKLFSALLALAMVIAVAPVALADDSRTVYVRDDEYYDEPVTSLAPGSSGWIMLETYEAGIKAPKNIKIDEIEVWDHEANKKISLVSVGKTASRVRMGADDRPWMAEISVKSVSASSYPEDGYDVISFTLKYNYDDTDYLVTVNLDTIAYEEGYDEFEDDPKMFSFDKDDDIEIDLPYSAGTFTGIARRDFEIIAAMDTKVDSSLLNKYPNADIQFFNGNGANFPVTSGKLTFYADSGDYLYEVSGSTLTDRSNTYSSSKNAFVVNTTIIGKYILSDAKLSGASTGGSASSSSTPSSSSQGEYIGTTPPPSTTPVVTNPNTGARA